MAFVSANGAKARHFSQARQTELTTIQDASPSLRSVALRKYQVLPVIAAIYAFLGALGLSLAIPPGYASPVFPAAGFALAAALCIGVKALPAIWFGSLILNVSLALAQGSFSPTTLLVAAGIGFGALLQAWAGQHFVRRWSEVKWRRLDHEKDILRFLALGGGLSCLISATMGATVLFFAGIVPASEIPFTWWNWYVGDALGVLTVGPLAVGLLLRRNPEWESRLKTIIPPVLVMLAIAVAMFVGAARWEKANQQARIAEHGSELAQVLEQRFIAHREVLASLARAIEITPNLELAQFDHFTRSTLREQTDLFALSFNPFVTLEQRPALERRMAKVYPDGRFEITERDAQRQLLRAKDRPEYVAVGYISPQEGNQAAIGFDIYSEPNRRDAITRARQSGRPAATAPIRLVQERQERVGVLLLSPAYHQASTWESPPPRGELMGFTVAVIKVDELVEIAIRGKNTSGIAIEIIDPAAQESHRTLYRSENFGAAVKEESIWESKLMMADREWVMKVFPTAAYLQQQRPWLAWATGVVGLLFAALLQLLLLAVSGRAAQIQRQVEAQTAEIRAKNVALAQSEESYRSVVESVKEVIFQTDAQGLWTLLNPAWTEVTGFPVLESLGTLFLDYVHPDDRERNNALFAPLIQREKDYCRHEVRYLRKDGGYRWIEVYARLLLDADDQVIGTSGTLLDITERRQADDKLREAMQASEAANIAKSRFLATMSHEIRTPMNGILGMAQLLLPEEVSATERQDYARTILNSGQSLLTLLNDILDLSKVEAGKMVLEQVPFQPSQLLHEIQALFQPAAQQKRLHLTVNWQGEPYTRYIGDANRLRQMLSNLVSNALKFTAQGNIDVTGRVLSDQGEHALLEISVADTGIGIPEDKCALLFKPFSQIDNSTTREFGGTGLGLSIVRSLATTMGGNVGVESSVGVGSRFWFRIRVDRIEDGEDTRLMGRAALAAAQGGPAIRVPSKLTGHVLVVEDNSSNRKVIEALLVKLSLTVSTAANGVAGVTAVKEGGPFDLILMDIQMPEMDGLAATQEIRRWEHATGRKPLPIIAVTADAFEEVRKRALEVGMDDFLAKPIVFDALQNCLGRWLKVGDIAKSVATDFRPLDPTELQAIFEKLIPLLAENKFDALNQFKTLQQAVSGTAYEEDIRRAGEPLQAFKFSTTLGRLREIAHEEGWELPE